MKDHLGSTHAVVDTSETVVSTQDFDMWGHPLKDRSWQTDDAKYDFTGKERDTETGYDYFGARYYNSRIGRWGGVEPLLDKYISFSPYHFCLSNPLKAIDQDGKNADILIVDNHMHITARVYYSTYAAPTQENPVGNPNGLTPDQINMLTQTTNGVESREAEIERYWSGSRVINGVRYNVTTDVQFINVGNDYNDALKYANRNNGNVLQSATTLERGTEGAEVVGGQLLRILNGKTTWHESTFAHEFAHIVGLSDSEITPKEGETPKIRDWILVHEKTGEIDKPRSKPKSVDYETILKKAQINLDWGRLRGYSVTN